MSVISKIIDNLSAKKSCGLDGISLLQLKYIKRTLLTPITLIIRQTAQEFLRTNSKSQFIKKMTNHFSVTIVLYLFYRPSPKLLKRLSIIRSIHFFPSTNYLTKVSTVFVLNILLVSQKTWQSVAPRILKAVDCMQYCAS